MRSQQRVIAALLTATFEAWRSLQTQLCCLLCALLSLAWCLSAQTSSTITGTVRDKQGLAVAGAEIRVTSAELAIERSTVTEPDGSYRLGALPPGMYAVRAAKDGLQAEVFKDLEVTLNRTLVYDVVQQVGSVQSDGRNLRNPSGAERFSLQQGASRRWF